MTKNEQYVRSLLRIGCSECGNRKYTDKVNATGTEIVCTCDNCDHQIGHWVNGEWK